MILIYENSPFQQSLSRVEEVCNRFNEAIQQFRKSAAQKIAVTVEARLTELSSISQPLNQHFTRVANVSISRSCRQMSQCDQL